jgi:hypothetical protein
MRCNARPGNRHRELRQFRRLQLVASLSASYVNPFYPASQTASDNPFSQILRQGRENKVKSLRASGIGLHEPLKAQ